MTSLKIIRTQKKGKRGEKKGFLNVHLININFRCLKNSYTNTTPIERFLY